MNTEIEIEIKEELERLVAVKLRSEFKFMYDHLVLISRRELEERSESMCDNDLTDSVNDRLHHEQMDQYHSSTSGSMTCEEARGHIENHEKRMAIIAEIYDAKAATQ